MNNNKTLLVVLDSDLTPSIFKLLLEIKLDYFFTTQRKKAYQALENSQQNFIVYQCEQKGLCIDSFKKHVGSSELFSMFVGYKHLPAAQSLTDFYCWPQDAVRLFDRLTSLNCVQVNSIHGPCIAIQESNIQLSNEQLMLKRFYAFIGDNYANAKLSLEDIADGIFVSPRPLQRKIKKLLHCTPMEYLRLYRIEKAKGLLSNTNLSILDVSQSTGFNTANYFSQIFKLVTGFKPSEYQQLLALSQGLKRAS